MTEIYWIDIADEQPEKGQYILYVAADVAQRVKTRAWGICYDDTDHGGYMGEGRVEWHYDCPSEELKYWIPIPKLREQV